MARTNPKPMKRGRPPLVAGETKAARLHLAVSERELRELHEAAAKAGVSVAEYIRRCVLDSA